MICRSKQQPNLILVSFKIKDCRMFAARLVADAVSISFHLALFAKSAQWRNAIQKGAFVI
jgi:hypothetical protein